METKRWYVVNTYSGHENKVKEKLEMRINSMNMSEYIFKVIVPEQKEIEVKDGITKEKMKKMFPGYVLVEMLMTDESWSVVRNTPGVTGFIGSSGKGAKPIPLLDKEIDLILGNMGVSKYSTPKEIQIGDEIKIIDGPFKTMSGEIEEIDLETEKITVLIDLFGQGTSVEVELYQIEKK